MKLLSELYKYQDIGVKAIHRRFDGRALLADDMGLGKTVQCIGYMCRYMDHGPTVVVAPAGLKYQWEDMLLEHANIPSIVLEGRTPQPLSLGGKVNKQGVYVINYDILGDPKTKTTHTWVRELAAIKPQLVIIDEVHAIKDMRTVRYRACKYLCRRVPHVLGVSGTPATNVPAELWPFLNICDPVTFDSKWDFYHNFCDPKRTRFGWEFKGCTRPKRLHRLLTSSCMIRRQKKDVLKDLPAKTRTVIPVEIKNRTEYADAEHDLIRWLVKKNKRHKALRALGSERLVRVGYLRRLASELKMDSVLEWIREFLKTGNKLIVFGVHHENVLDRVSAEFKHLMVRVDGRTPNKMRKLYQDVFNKDDRVRLFVGNVDAAGVGWSCTSASDILFVETPWTPGRVTQAEDRIHGVKRGVVGRKAQIHFIVAKDTIEERIIKLLHRKQKDLGKVLDGKAAEKFDIADLLEAALLEAA